jgi:hypothetical protein
MAIEALELDEETRIGEVAVDDADRLVGIERDGKMAANLLDRFEMARSDLIITCDPDQRKGFHLTTPPCPVDVLPSPEREGQTGRHCRRRVLTHAAGRATRA